LRWQFLGPVEVARVLRALPGVELARRSEGPGPLVRRLREEGRGCVRRSSTERSRLRAVIRALDVRLPGGGNCYRRALLEIALDPDTAEEPLYMGLVAAGGPRSGHAWLGSDGDEARSYDAVVAI